MRLFIHIPKNGGMSVRRGMSGRIVLAERRNLPPDYADRLLQTMSAAGEHHGFEHARWRDVRQDVRKKHQAFAIVRNPWSRCVSRYTFAKVAGDRSGDKTFREFLDERHEYGGREFYWHRAIRGWYPQKDYVTDDGVLRCDVLRLESDDVQRYLGLNKPMQRRGVSNTKGHDYRTFYGNEEYDIVADWYKDDIEYFGFDFDTPATRHLWTLSS